MSTLTMALAAVLLAESAPENVSGETKQVLDLRGEWEGTYHDTVSIEHADGTRPVARFSESAAIRMAAP